MSTNIGGQVGLMNINLCNKLLELIGINLMFQLK